MQKPKANFVSMKEGIITVRGKERKFTYKVEQKIDLVYATIVDANGEQHLMVKNDKGEFLGAWSTRFWPTDLLDALNAFLLLQHPSRVEADNNWLQSPGSNK